MTTNFVSKGTTIIKEAVTNDNAEKYEIALSLYSQGIQYLMTGLKYEKNKIVIAAIKEKVEKYLTRAEDIKNSLEEQKQMNDKKSKSKKGNMNIDCEADKESMKLEQALSSSIMIGTPDVSWDEVAGLEVAKGLLKEAVILPIKFPQLFVGKRKPWTGILLYGPPGTGKSYLAQAVASQATKSTFFSISSSDLVSKYVGESSRLIRKLFQMARERKPSIIFIDEIDSLATKRSDGEHDNSRRIKTEFLVQMQGVGKSTRGVLTLGATNCPWDLDPAVRRRFPKRIYIPLPEERARQTMFKIHIGDTPHSLKEQDYAVLAKRTPGFSGSDIASMVQDALMEPLRTMQYATHFMQIPNPENKNDYVLMPCSPSIPNARAMSLMDIPVEEHEKVRAEDLKLAHFLRILATCKPSVGHNDIQRHIDWTNQFGQEG